ncbi:MAG: hypothetical protein ACI87Q_000862 [Pseudohongiellaceae bacterium]
MTLTDYLAIYAASLSTLVFFWNFVSARPRLKVRLSPGSKVDGDKVLFGVYVSIQNISAHTVHVSHLSLLYPYQDASLKEKLLHVAKYRRMPKTVGWVHTSPEYFDVDRGLPISVEARSSHDVFVPDEALEEIFEVAVARRIRAIAQDALWQNTYSNILDMSWRVQNKAKANSSENAA